MKCDPGVPKLKTVMIMERAFFRKKVLSPALNVQWRDLRILRGRRADVIDVGPELPRDDQAGDRPDNGIRRVHPGKPAGQ